MIHTKTPSNFISGSLRETLYNLSSCFDNMILMVDFNVEQNEANIQKEPNLI